MGNVSPRFFREREGKKTHLVFLSRTPVAWANKLSLPLSLPLSLSRSFPNKELTRSSNGAAYRSERASERKNRRGWILVVEESQRSCSLFDACTHYKSLRKEAPTPNPCQDNSELLGPRGVQDFDLYRNANRAGRGRGAALNGLITPRPPSALRLPLLHKLPRQRGRSRKN